MDLGASCVLAFPCWSVTTSGPGDSFQGDLPPVMASPERLCSYTPSKASAILAPGPLASCAPGTAAALPPSRILMQLGEGKP